MKFQKTNKLLGELEAEIMEVIWKLDKAAVRDVLNVLRKKKKIAYTTIMTVMSRLADKGILKRKLDQSGAYFYTPCQGREAFLANASKKMIDNLIREFGEVAVAQFIDAVESSNFKNLARWRAELKKIK